MSTSLCSFLVQWGGAFPGAGWGFAQGRGGLWHLAGGVALLVAALVCLVCMFRASAPGRPRAEAQSFGMQLWQSTQLLLPLGALVLVVAVASGGLALVGGAMFGGPGTPAAERAARIASGILALAALPVAVHWIYSFSLGTRGVWQSVKSGFGTLKKQYLRLLALLCVLWAMGLAVQALPLVGLRLALFALLGAAGLLGALLLYSKRV